jgi:hypothetical protein
MQHRQPYSATANWWTERNIIPPTIEAAATHGRRYERERRRERPILHPEGCSLNDMFKVVATVFQQITTELNGAESKEDRIVAIINIVLKLMKQNGC